MVLAALSAATDDSYIVSPGIEGFISFLVLAIIAWLLFASLTRHVRKATFHGEEREAEKYGSVRKPARFEIPVDPTLGEATEQGEPEGDADRS